MVTISGAIAVVLLIGVLAFEHTSQQQLTSLCLEDQDIAVGACGKKTTDATEQCSTTTAKNCVVNMSTTQVNCGWGHVHWYPLASSCKPDSSEAKSACTKHYGAALGASTEHGYKLENGDAGTCGTWSGTTCSTPVLPHSGACTTCHRTIRFNGKNCIPGTATSGNCSGTTKVAVSAGC